MTQNKDTLSITFANIKYFTTSMIFHVFIDFSLNLYLVLEDFKMMSLIEVPR